MCVSAGIDSVFSKTGCDASAITDMLGGHAGVTDSTVLQYLGIVEQRTNELLQLQAFIQAKVASDNTVCKDGWGKERETERRSTLHCINITGVG